MSTIDQLDLRRLGDDLERATGRSLRRHRRVRVAAIVIAALALVGGTAAATALFTPHQVAAGMPAGSALFGQTDPTCVLDSDGATFHCTLASMPVPEPLPQIREGAKRGLNGSGPMDYQGSKEVVAIDGHAAGGCIGQDHQGLLWDCWMGDLAVQHAIISQDFLGEPVAGPGVG